LPPAEEAWGRQRLDATPATWPSRETGNEKTRLLRKGRLPPPRCGGARRQGPALAPPPRRPTRLPAAGPTRRWAGPPCWASLKEARREWHLSAVRAPPCLVEDPGPSRSEKLTKAALCSRCLPHARPSFAVARATARPRRPLLVEDRARLASEPRPAGVRPLVAGCVPGGTNPGDSRCPDICKVITPDLRAGTSPRPSRGKALGGGRVARRPVGLAWSIKKKPYLLLKTERWTPGR